MTCAAARTISSLATLGALLGSAQVGLAQAPAAPPPAAPGVAPQPRAVPAAPAPAAPPPAAAAPAPAPVPPPPAAAAPPVAPVPAPLPPAPPPAAAVPPPASSYVGPPEPTPPAAAALAPNASFTDAPPPPLPLPEGEALPEGEESRWYDEISLGAFVDGYFGVDFNFPKSPGQARQNPIRAYDGRSGFGLHWAGIDIQRSPEPIGGVISLRLGPGAQRLAEACVDGDTCDGSSSLGLSYVKQAFGSWKPGGAGSAVSLDLGKFDTPYGAEVAESQFNINYTRGVLYWLGQPAYHTGLRVGIDASRNVNLKVLAVNGWNRTVDNNLGKTLGLQGTFRLPKLPGSDEDQLTLSLGYLVGPEHADSGQIVCGPGQRFDPDANPDTGCVPSAGSPGEVGLVDRGSSNTKGLRHFLDLTLIAQPTTELKLLFNASLGIDRDRDPEALGSFVSKTWYGLMGGARMAIGEQFGVAGRAEYYGDPDGYTTGESISLGEDLRYVTGTLSLDYAPTELLVVILDGRLDWSSKQVFPKGARDADVGTAVSATLGAIVTTN